METTTPLAIITEFLQGIPPKVRKVILLVFAALVVVTVVLKAVGFSDSRLDTALLIIGGYLGVQSGANVDDEPDVTEWRESRESEIENAAAGELRRGIDDPILARQAEIAADRPPSEVKE